MDWNAYNFLFSKAQYELVPRILSYSETTSLDMGEYRWLIALKMEPLAVDQLAKQHGLQIVQTCDNMTILTSSAAQGMSQ